MVIGVPWNPCRRTLCAQMKTTPTALQRMLQVPPKAHKFFHARSGRGDIAQTQNIPLVRRRLRIGGCPKRRCLCRPRLRQEDLQTHLQLRALQGEHLCLIWVAMTVQRERRHGTRMYSTTSLAGWVAMMYL